MTPINKQKIIHKSAFIDIGAKIGSGTKIWHNSHITNSAVIGKNCIIGQNCYVAGKIGDYCKLQNNVNVYQGVTLGNYVFCGPSMTFTNDLNPRSKYPKNGKWLKTIVGDEVTLGAGCVILCNIKIGKRAFIGAGSTVTKNVPDYALACGNPAKEKGYICACGQKMKFSSKNFTCLVCKKTFVQTKLSIKEIKNR